MQPQQPNFHIVFKQPHLIMVSQIINVNFINRKPLCNILFSLHLWYQIFIFLLKKKTDSQEQKNKQCLLQLVLLNKIKLPIVILIPQIVSTNLLQIAPLIMLLILNISLFFFLSFFSFFPLSSQWNNKFVLK